MHTLGPHGVLTPVPVPWRQASLVPLLLGCEQLVLVGDSRQLPPTVADVSAGREGLGCSLFERLQALGVPPLLLDTQYRMHPALAAFSSATFYDGRLRSAVPPEARPPPAGLDWPNPDCPIAFVPVRGGGETREWVGVAPATEGDAAGGGGGGGSGAADGGSTSYANSAEAEIVCEIVEVALRAGGLAAKDLGVITPYAAQATLIKGRLAERAAAAAAASDDAAEAISVEEIEVSSVDGFQGREKELIVVSTVRSNRQRRIGFVTDERRLNVAITRARSGLVLVGDDDTLAGSGGVWRAYLAFLGRQRCVLPASGGTAGLVSPSGGGGGGGGSGGGGGGDDDGGGDCSEPAARASQRIDQ